MTKPHESTPEQGADRGASSLRQLMRGEQPERVGELVARGKDRWDWVKRTRAWRAFSRFTDVNGTVLASGMSYQALFAVFAALYIGFGVTGIWLQSRPDLLKQVVEQINLFVPGLLGPHGVVPEEALLATRVLSWTSLVAGGSLIWVSITWFTGTRRAIRLLFDLEVKQYRNAVLLKLRDLMLAFGFFVLIIISAALTVLSSNVISALIDWFGWDPHSWLVGGLGTTARFAAMYLVDVIVLWSIHVYLAEVRVERWLLLRGCLLGATVLFGLKLLGTTLLGGATSNPLLASFAVLIGLLLWFNFICRTLLLTSSWIAVGADRTLGLSDDGVTPLFG